MAKEEKLSEENTIKTIKTILREKCNVTKKKIEQSDRLEYELQLTQLQKFVLQYWLEIKFSFPQDDMDGEITGEMDLKDLVRYILTKVNSQEEEEND